MMPHDQIGQMAEAGLIYPNTKYEKKSKKTILTRQSQESLERQSLCLPLCRRVTSSLL